MAYLLLLDQGKGLINVLVKFESHASILTLNNIGEFLQACDIALQTKSSLKKMTKNLNLIKVMT